MTRFKCVHCGKITAGRLPRSGRHEGDGTVWFPRRHKSEGKPCPGNIMEAEPVDVSAPVMPPLIQKPQLWVCRLSDTAYPRILRKRRAE